MKTKNYKLQVPNLKLKVIARTKNEDEAIRNTTDSVAREFGIRVTVYQEFEI